MKTKTIVTNHAIHRYQKRVERVSRKKAIAAIKLIIEENGINPHEDVNTVFSISAEKDAAVIMVNDDNGDLVVKTILTINQFNDQMRRIALGLPKDYTCDVLAIQKVGHEDGVLNTDIQVTIGGENVY